MNSCELIALISSVACRLPKEYSAEELALLGTIFTQLGDTISTIVAHESLCDKNK